MYLEKICYSSLKFFIVLSEVEGDIIVNRPFPSIVGSIVIVRIDVFEGSYRLNVFSLFSLLSPFLHEMRYNDANLLLQVSLGLSCGVKPGSQENNGIKRKA
jgi:hypothetical protein